MFRFIALLWDTESAEQAARASAIRAILDDTACWIRDVAGNGIAVFHSGPESSSKAYVLGKHDGVIVGTLFDRTESRVDGGPKRQLSEKDCARIIDSDGRSLITDFWGRYVAVVRGRDSGTVRVIRDPSGHMPCYRTRDSQVLIFFSYFGDIVRLGIRRFSMNWDYLVARVVHFGLQSRETAFQEVDELQAGECEVIERGAVSRVFYWHPFRFAEQECCRSPARLAEELRSTTYACVRSWARCYEAVLLRLSGGLDSSIVLSCLRDAGPEITCLTWYPAGAESRGDTDERRFARAAAESAGCRCVEIPRTPGVDLAVMREMGLFPVPMIFSGRNVEEAAVERRIALEVGATARFGGEGGDQVFFQGPAPPTVSDCLADRGMSPGLFRLAWNVARREQLSIWEILKQALASGLNPSPWRPYPQALFAAEFVSAGVLDTLSHTDWLDRRFIHSWFLSPRDLPPGKLWHILWLSWSPKLYTAMEQAGDPERVEPLTSQPLLELCLRIPTFLLSSGAEDRSLARNAFFRDLPPGIRTRRSKGSIERFIRQTLLNNLAFVREALVDGVLAKAGLLDCARLASALSGTPERVASAPVYLFDLLAMEIWARSVSDLLGPAKS